MNISYIRHINAHESNRIEFLLVNYDYIDGNQLISKILTRKYGFELESTIDGIHYNICKLTKDNNEYQLVWHEDVGNYVFSESREHHIIEEFEKILIVVIDELNRILKTN